MSCNVAHTLKENGSTIGFKPRLHCDIKYPLDPRHQELSRRPNFKSIAEGAWCEAACGQGFAEMVTND
jgi:hypothetical protein